MTEKDLQIQELKKEIQKLKEQVPQWIPIKERLPERGRLLFGRNRHWRDFCALV